MYSKERGLGLARSLGGNRVQHDEWRPFLPAIQITTS
jgi:hypothetical protein